MPREDLFKDTTRIKPELVLQHCFKQYKLRDFIFGPPKSRRRIIIAPPMVRPASAESCSTIPKEASETEDDLPKLEAWIMERRKLRSQLDSLVNVEKWLRQKLSTTEQEERVLENLQDSRAVRKAKRQRVIPLINAPYPQSLITLHNLLHKQKLKMVDLFRKADKDKKRFIRSDFIKVIKEVHRNQVKNTNLKFFLIRSKVCFLLQATITSLFLVITARARLHTQKIVSTSVSIPASADGKTKEGQSLTPSEPGAKLTLLEVPPINTEPDHRPLSYDEMEEVGRRCRNRKRWEKVLHIFNPIEWLECCRLVRSGNKAIDDHCLPSTVESDIGEVIDQHRRNCYLVYLQCLKLCNEYNVPLTEKVLEKALLYPGDRIIKEGEYVRKIRQPGGPYASVDGSHHQTQLLLSRQGIRNKLSHLSCKSHDNNFWPGHLLDKLRIYLPQMEPNKEQALFSYVRPTPPVYPGIYNPHRSWPVSSQGYTLFKIYYIQS
uniref:EF-hand calcium binding domain 12 n=1 Tax=Pelusios castaneus TaxID=367368 RepID=A0A8C8SML9_9SAUR